MTESKLKSINLEEWNKAAVSFLFTKRHVLFQWFNYLKYLEQVFLPRKVQLSFAGMFYHK